MKDHADGMKTMCDGMTKMCDTMEGLHNTIKGVQEKKAEAEDADFIPAEPGDEPEKKEAKDSAITNGVVGGPGVQ